MHANIVAYNWTSDNKSQFVARKKCLAHPIYSMSDQIRSVSTDQYSTTVFMRHCESKQIIVSKVVSEHLLVCSDCGGSLGFSRMKSGSHNIALISRGSEGCIIIADLELA